MKALLIQNLLMDNNNAGLDNKNAEIMIDQVNQKSNSNYVFGGPQSSDDPDLASPEFVTRVPVNDNMNFLPSAHQARNDRLEQYHQCEIDQNQLVPDYYVNLEENRRFHDENLNMRHFDSAINDNIIGKKKQEKR